MVVQEQEEELGLWGRKGLLGRYMYKYSMECGCGRGVPRCGVEKVCFPHHATGWTSAFAPSLIMAVDR